MMEQSSEQSYLWWKSLGVTCVFCVVISIATYFVWPGNFYYNLLISFGYGLSGVASSSILIYFFSSLSSRVINILSVSSAMALGTTNAYFWLSGTDGMESIEAMKSVILLAFIFTAICFYYFYNYEKRLEAQQIIEASLRKQSEQEKALALSQLSQLQSQIEPHFLFNTLANAIALIDQDTDKAKLMLVRLTDMFRTNLNKSRENVTTLEEEVALISSYLDIQQIRLGDRLSYSVINNNIDMQQGIPPLLVQPLVENAVYYGIEPKATGGHVDLVISEAEDELLIEVIDNGYGIQPTMSSGGHGLGLENIRSRLAALFDGAASLTIKEPSQGGVVATIRLPKTQLGRLEENAEYG